MARSRSLASLSALLLATTLGATTLVATPAASAVVASAGVKEVVRQYGDKPVRQDRSGQVVEIRFKGHRGDLVMLTSAKSGDVTPMKASLTGPGGAVPRGTAPWFELTRNGWHTIRTRPAAGSQRARVLLNEVRAVAVTRDAAATTMAARRGLVYAAGFEVPASGMLSGAVSGPGVEQLARPGKATLTAFDDTTLLLGAGLPLAPYTSKDARTKYAAGSVIRVLARSGQASAVTPTRVSATIDGPAVTIDRSDPARVTEVVLPGTPGQWVHAPEGLAENGLDRTMLLGGEGYVTASAVPGLWRLPAKGTDSRFLVFPSRSVTDPLSIDFDSLTEGPALALGAAPAKVTQTVAGRGVILPVTGLATGASAKVAASAVALPGDWRVHLLVPRLGCAGCGTGDLVSATPAQPTSPSGKGTWVYIPFAPGTTGSVDLQVLPG